MTVKSLKNCTRLLKPALCVQQGGDMPKIVDRAEMQARILTAAMRCFQQQGFHVTKMTDIARAAEMAKGTLYLYFKSKDALMLALLRSYFDDIRARISMLPAPAMLDHLMMGIRLSMPVERLADTQLFMDVLGPGFQDPEAGQVIGDFMDWLSDQYADQLRGLQDAGQVRADLDPVQSGRAIVALLDGLTMHLAVFRTTPQEFEVRRDAALDLIRASLA